MGSGTAAILCERRGAAGFVTLNRPDALNALNLAMVRGLAAALDEWERDPAITRVVVTGAGGKAFCAGGDIRTIHDQCKSGRADEAIAFWAEEYRLNIHIKNYSKPYISLIDGIVMGGGVGISLHGSHIVAGDRYLFAMPEVGIGFFPDVGGSYALPRIKGSMGTWLALTGARVGAADALALGLATHAVPSSAMADLPAALCEGRPVDEVLAAASRDPGPSPAMVEAGIVADCFSRTDIAAIMSCLEDHPDSVLARDALAAMRTKSPTSQAIALRQMQLGARLSFEEAMAMEFRIVNRIIEGKDFFEGVRALLIDKDKNPVWRPASANDVTAATVDPYFAPLPNGRELHEYEASL